MSDFKAKMHIIRFSLDLRPTPRWVSLQHSPRSQEGRKTGGKENGRGVGKERRGREGRASPGQAPKYFGLEPPLPMGPVGRVPSNFGDNGDEVYLVPSNFCNWLLFFAGHCGKQTRPPR